MKIWKRILPILLIIVVLGSIAWYLFVYDKAFTKDLLLGQARAFELNGNHQIATWLYDLAYQQSNSGDDVAIEIAHMYKSHGNYSKAEYTLSNAIAAGGSAQLYIALCQTYVEQDKLLDAVNLLDRANPNMKDQLESLRPAAPIATPTPGFYSQYISITLTSDSGTLYASCNGEYPSIKKDLYTQEIPISLGENTVYALSISDNGLVSPLSVFGYTVGGVIEQIQLADSNLDAQVRQTLNITPETPLMSSDLWSITSLVLPKGMTQFSDLQYFPQLTTLTLDQGGAADLQALSYLTQLTHLTVTNTQISDKDLAIIAALPNLKELTLSNCMLSGINKLSGAQNLNYLDLSNNTIRDASALSFMSGLETLKMSHNALTNLSYFSALKNLKLLDVSYNSLSSIVPLTDCIALEQLDVSHNTLGSLSGLDSLKNLTMLNANNNKLTEVDLLAGLTALTELRLSHNTLLDIAPLSTLEKLQFFDLSHNEITALPQWSKDCALVHIDATNNRIKNIDNLGGCKSLNTVILNDNAISSVDALANCPNLIRVDVANNPVKDISKLKDQSIIVNYTPR